MAIGFLLPFVRASGSLGWLGATETELDAVAANLKSLLLTNWGERVGHYSFGCNLIEFLFENAGPAELKERIADRIISQTKRWLPFVQIDVLNVIFPDENPVLQENQMGIYIKFRLVSRPNFSSVLDLVVSH